jgi:hypothetical protein
MSDDLSADGELRVPCRVYSRVCGYLTAVEDWNRGKQQEFADRTVYDARQPEEDAPGAAVGEATEGE